MDGEAGVLLQGTPPDGLYDAAMATVKPVRLEDARKNLGNLVDEAERDGVHFPMSKYGRTKAVVVPIDWYRQAREAVGDPTDL